MAKFNATDLLVYVGAIPIAHSTSATITIDVDLPDATTKDSAGWADHIAGVRNWSIDFDGLVDYAASYGVEELFNNLLNRNVLTVKWSSTQVGGTYLTGQASVSNLTQTADMEQPVSYSGTFTGKGALSMVAVGS
jgi:predicted secreted protein